MSKAALGCLVLSIAVPASAQEFGGIGRVFDRRFFEAHDAGSRPLDDTASLAATWLLQATAAWRW